MTDTVWHRIDRELERRKDRRLSPSTWAELGRTIEASDQVMHNWRKRGVPAHRHADIAAALGWSVDQLLGREENNSAGGLAQAAGAYERHTASAPPPPPPKGFRDRHEVGPSDWALLQDIHDLMAVPQKARQLQEMLDEVRALRRHISVQSSERIKALQEAGGGHAGGMSAFGDLDEAREHKKKRGQQ